MYPVTMLWYCVHPKRNLVALRPWPAAFSNALRNKLNLRAKWDQSLTDVAINSHRICWVGCSQFCINGFFVVCRGILKSFKLQTSAIQLEKFQAFVSSWWELLKAALLRCSCSGIAWWAASSWAGAEELTSLSVKALCYQNCWIQAPPVHDALQHKVKSLF